MRALAAGVFLEGFLGQAVEGERGDGTFKPRRGETPRAVGAAPAGEVVPIDPDQASTHTSFPPFACVLGLELGDRRNTQESELGRWILPVAGTIFHGIT